MRRLPAALTVIGLSALALAGCAAAPTSEAGCVRPVSDAPSVFDGLSITGDVGTTPVVTLDGMIHTTTTAYKDFVTGSGVRFAEPSQLLGASLTIINGTTGAVTPVQDGGVFGSAALVEAFPGFADALHCAAEGSRVVVAFESEDVAPFIAEQFELLPQDTVVAVFDVRKVLLDRAEGSLEFNAGFGLPSVVRAPDGRPGVIVPDGAAPTAATSQVLIRGGGAPVAADTPLYAHVTKVRWSDRSVISNTWDAAAPAPGAAAPVAGTPETLDISTLPESVQDAVVGVPLGSQVMVVEPADGDATVWVLDLLGSLAFD